MLLEQITSDGEQDEAQQPDTDQNPKKTRVKHKKKNSMKAKLGSGARFAAIANKAQGEYEKKGMSPEHAKQVAGAIAASVGRKKYGAKKFSKLSAMAR